MLRQLLSATQGSIRPALTRIYEQYVAKHRASSEALLSARENLSMQEETLVERREENTAAEAQVQCSTLQFRSLFSHCSTCLSQV